MTTVYNDSPEEILASGPIYFNDGKTLLGRKTWDVRKIEFTGIYLLNYHKSGVLKGKWNILDHEVKSITAEEIGTADAKFAFAIYSRTKTRKVYLFCAIDENDKQAWMKLLTEQISFRKDILSRYLFSYESIISISIVTRSKGFLMPSKSTLYMIMTDASRILLIDTISEALVDQMVWDPRCSPNATIVSENVLKLQLEKKVFRVTFNDSNHDIESHSHNGTSDDKSRNTITSIFEDDDIPHKPTTAIEWQNLIFTLPQDASRLQSRVLESILEDVFSK